MSKKRSNTSGLLDTPPVVLLDENLSSPDIAEELGRWVSDWTIKLHKECFPNPRTPDVEVLERCASEGWILVSVDDKMRYRADSKRIARIRGARVFLFPRAYTSGAEYRAALTAGRHRLLKLARKMPPPNFARITREGSVGHFRAPEAKKQGRVNSAPEISA